MAVGERFCSVCRRWLPKRGIRWRNDPGGAWVCGGCAEREETRP